MFNIWTFLLQTSTVTLTACFLLFVKFVFQDKLSPRWQYGAWSVLVVRLLIPVATERYFLIPLPLWLEQIKSMTERTLTSAYSSAYEPLQMSSVVPVVFKMPTSLTDFLFVLYAAGVCFVLVRYCFSYWGLKQLLTQCSQPSEKQSVMINQLSRELKVKPCRVVVMENIQSAFITGIVHPVLVLPYAQEVDTKVLMHELLHLKCYDSFQNTFWCLMRALHWCNPVMHLVFDRIGNDIESLCDQRVLERLEGNELREYGMILLNMANDQYARAIGTSSISNGGKNISRRIEAITRFKKYPKGMALVSISILVVLAGSMLQGNAYEISQDTYFPSSYYEFERAMALTRINRCTTLAGAIDTYAKSLILENGLYLATVSPVSQQKEIYHKMSETGTYSQIEVSNLLEEVQDNYSIYNLTKISDSYYKAVLLIGKGYATEETDQVFAQNIIIFKDKHWVVIPEGNPVLLSSGIYDQEIWFNKDLGEVVQLETTSEHGTVAIRVMSYHEISNSITTNNGLPFMDYTAFDSSIKTAAEFERSSLRTVTYYDYSALSDDMNPQEYVEVQTDMVMTKDEKPEYLELQSSAYSGGGYNMGQNSVRANIEYIADKHLESSAGSSSSNDLKHLNNMYGFYVRIIWDGEIVEELFIERGAQ